MGKSLYLELEDLEEDIVVIKIKDTYRSGMSAEALYEATRGIWKRKMESVERAKFCLAVHDKIVIEVYQITGWNPAGTTPMKTRILDPDHFKGRIEFIGKVAPDEIRNKYIGKSVAHLYKWGEANPVKTFWRL